MGYKATKRQILIKLLSQKDSFEASIFLKDEFKLLDLEDLM